jgi:hypothetical protein
MTLEKLETGQKESGKSWHWFYMCFKKEAVTTIFYEDVFIGKEITCDEKRVDRKLVNGWGLLISDFKEIRIGTFVGGALEGHGVVIDSEWKFGAFKHTGNYSKGDYNGYGVRTYNSETIYEGSWNGDQLVDGPFKITYFDGTTYTTEWRATMSTGHPYEDIDHPAIREADKHGICTNILRGIPQTIAYETYGSWADTNCSTIRYCLPCYHAKHNPPARVYTLFVWELDGSEKMCTCLCLKDNTNLKRIGRLVANSKKK